MTISPYLVFLLLFAVGIAQSAWGPFLSFNGNHPDVLVVAVLAWSLMRSLREAALWAVIGGAMLDLLSPTPFGIFTFSLLVMAVLANFWQDRMAQGGSFVLFVVFALPYTLFFNLLSLAMIQLTGYNANWFDALRQVIFPVSVMNMLAMAIIYPLLAMVNRRTQKGELHI